METEKVGYVSPTPSPKHKPTEFKSNRYLCLIVQSTPKTPVTSEPKKKVSENSMTGTDMAKSLMSILCHVVALLGLPSGLGSYETEDPTVCPQSK